jgi:hypothetical protein
LINGAGKSGATQRSLRERQPFNEPAVDQLF